MKLIIVFTLFILLNPSLAYTSSDGTVVIHRRNRKKALLDYKFLLIDSSSPKSQSESRQTDQAGLSNLSKNSKTISQVRITPQKITKNNESWDYYAQEETCDVSAKIINNNLKKSTEPIF
ncbi:MAG: hypothetical protein RLZZ361_600 [Cyanobacteriota bacterium]|jgi:hypothetical protein